VKAREDLIDDSRLALPVLGLEARLAPDPDGSAAIFNLRREGPGSGVAVYRGQDKLAPMWRTYQGASFCLRLQNMSAHKKKIRDDNVPSMSTSESAKAVRGEDGGLTSSRSDEHLREEARSYLRTPLLFEIN
jgi:hypothetical protein